jgi:hypothetical protein
MTQIPLFSVAAVIFFLARGIFAQGTDLGGGVITRADVEYLANLALDVRDIDQLVSSGSTAGLSIYLEGKNSEKQVGVLFKLAQLSTDLAKNPIADATPTYLFHLYGAAGRSKDLSQLSSNGGYADSYVRSALNDGKPTSSKAILVLNVWMYATHVLYQGVDMCQKKINADNPSQFDVGSGGLDEFIALWIGSGQTHGSSEGFSLYALAESSERLFAVTNDDTSFLPSGNGDLEESSVNRNLKLLYQEGAALFSLPDVCTSKNADTAKKLWSVTSRIISQMYIPVIRMLIISILEQDSMAIDLYANALIPQASQCRPSTFNRVKEELLEGDVNFDRTAFILDDIEELYHCFGLTCDDIGTVSKTYEYVASASACAASRDDTPMALYQPTTEVHPVSIFSYLLGVYLCVIYLISN